MGVASSGPACLAQEVVLGLPALGARVPSGACERDLLPAHRALAADRTWLVRAAAAATLPALAALLPEGRSSSRRWLIRGLFLGFYGLKNAR